MIGGGQKAERGINTNTPRREASSEEARVFCTGVVEKNAMSVTSDPFLLFLGEGKKERVEAKSRRKRYGGDGSMISVC